MMKRMIRLLRTQRGQTLIEFAFVAPIMFLFLFAIVDFGISIDRRIALQHAVREGARYGAVHSVVTDIEQQTADQAQGIIDPTDVTVCYIDGGDGNLSFLDPGDAVRVAASFTWEFPIMAEIFSAFGVAPLSIDMTPSGTARLETSVTDPLAFECPA